MLQLTDPYIACHRYPDGIRKKPAEIERAVSGKAGKLCKGDLFLDVYVDVRKYMVENMAAHNPSVNKMYNAGIVRSYDMIIYENGGDFLIVDMILL